MTIARAQVVLNRKSLISRDAVTNTWHFDTGGSGVPGDWSGIATELANFYVRIAALFAATVSAATDAHRVKVYNLGEIGEGDFLSEGSGPPVHEQTFTLAGVAATALPAEVAVSLTLEAGSRTVSEQSGVTRPAARRRGRVFLGPLVPSIGALESGTNEMYVTDANRTAILNSANTLRGNLATLAGPVAMGVLSRQDGVFRQLTGFSMDDAFDVVRSRGNRPRSRVKSAAYPTLALGA